MPLIDKIEWLGHAAFRIKGNQVIYFDPFEIEDNQEKADLIFITHEHFDHCSPDDIAKIQKDSTTVIASEQCAEKISGNIRLVQPGDVFDIEGTTVKVVPAYNVDKFREPGLPYHPQKEKKVGYILTIDKEGIYHAGDTDFIPEMKELKDIDIALIPVSGKYVMTAEEAAKATSVIHPKTAIPMHYGSVVGTITDAEKFKQLVNTEVVTLKKRG